MASLRKQLTFDNTITGLPAKWHQRNKRRNSILMLHHYPDLGSTSDWTCRVGNLIQPIRSTTKIWVVMRHQYGISAFVFDFSDIIWQGNQYPGYQRFFSRAEEIFGVGRRPKPRAGEAARKTSGTERCFLPSPLTFALFYRSTLTPIRLKVSDCDHVGRHVKKCPKTHIILSKTSWSLKFIVLRAIMTGSHRSSP